MTFDEWFDREGYDEQHRLVFGLAWHARMDTERDSHRIVTDGPFCKMTLLETKVAAERERWRNTCAGKRHEGCLYLAVCGSVCNKCGKVA